jgi:hypothetical protein
MTILARVSPGYQLTSWQSYSSRHQLKRRTVTALDPNLQVPHSYIVDEKVFRLGVKPNVAGGGNYLWEVNNFTYQQFVKAFKGVKGIALTETPYPKDQDEILFCHFRRIFNTEEYSYDVFLFKPSPEAEEVPIYF